MQSGLRLLIMEKAGAHATPWRSLLDSPVVGPTHADFSASVAASTDLLERHLYDAFLFDFGADHFDGVGSIARLCVRFPAVAVVVVIDPQQSRIGVEAMAAGAQDTLDKGAFDAAHLANVLRRAIARQRLDVELRQSAEDHRVLFDSNPYPLIVYDINTLRVLAVNAASVRQYGYTGAEFLKKSLFDLWPTDETTTGLEAMKARREARISAQDWHHRRKNGNVFDVEISENAIRYRGRRARILVARDITAHKRGVRALEANEMRFRQLFQYSLGLIFTHDLDGTLLSVNPAAARALDYPIAQMLGRNLSEFLADASRDRFVEYLARVTANGDDSGKLRLLTSKGEEHIWEFQNILDSTSADEPYVLGHAQDITERERYEGYLKEQSLRDPLTLCFNRRYLEEYVATDETSWGCIVIDLDHFKAINDTYGHQRGDEVLVLMGQFLTRHADKDDIVVRMGGDEFLVLLIAADAIRTEQIAERLQAMAQRDAPALFSVGYATREQAETLESTIQRADSVLYALRVASRGTAKQAAASN